MSLLTENQPLDAPHVQLNWASWDLYEHLLEEIDRHGQNIRLTYFDDSLELQSLPLVHEHEKKLIDRMLFTIVMECDLDIASYGSSTFKSKRLRMAVEPDECYYFQHAPEMRHRRRISMTKQPPDLILEVHPSADLIDKGFIYAAMGVPEVWTYDAGELRCLLLKRGKYRESKTSRAIPFFKPATMQPFVAKAWRKARRHLFERGGNGCEKTLPCELDR